MRRSPAPEPRSRRAAIVDAVAIAGVGVFVFGFRYMANSGFSNDHFVHVVQGQQVVLGAWPIRDFVDPGWPLTYLMSAAAMLMLGHSMLAEAVLVCAAFAVAAMLTLWLTRRSGVPLIWGLAAVAFQLFMMPRSYGYPKLLVYAIAAVACWRFVERPGAGRAVALAAAAVVGYLFRHDHGLLIGATSLLAVAWAGGAARLKLAGVYTLACLLLLAPWAAYVQTMQGLVPYFSSAIAFSRVEAHQTKLALPTIELGSADAGVASTSDRHPEANAHAVLFYLFIALPVVWLAAVPFLPAERRVQVAYGAALALLVDATMLRDPLDARLPDVVMPVSLLVGWSLAWGFRWLPDAGLARRIAGPVLAVALIVVAAPAVSTVGHVPEQFNRVGGLGWEKLREHIPEKTARLRSDYDDGMMPSDVAAGLVPVFEYLKRCTRTSDRFLHIGYDPEVHFYANRGFAAGHGAWLNQYYISDEEQQRSLRQLQRERVPIAIVPDESAEWFTRDFAVVSRWVASRYRQLATFDVGGDGTAAVLVDTTLTPSGTDATLGWPCFR